MSGRRVAVTGGCGRLGRYVVRALADAGAVTVLDRREEAQRRVDVTDLAAVRRAVAGHDSVVHLAALPGPRAGPPEDIFRINAIGTWNVVQAACEAGVRRLVLCSSEYVAGASGPAGLIPEYLPIDENHPLRPSEAYAASKEAAEAIGRMAARRGDLEVVTLRPTLILFPEDRDRLAAKGRDIDDPDLWSYVAAEDAAQAVRLALAAEVDGYGVFFISAPTTYSPIPTLELVERRFGRLPEVRRPELYEREPHAAVFDIDRARRALGYAPAVSWRDAAPDSGGDG